MSETTKDMCPNPDALRFFTELARQMCGGQPLVRALKEIRTQFAGQPMDDVLTDMIRRIKDGSVLSDAMAKQPEVFNEGILALIAAGETAGVLDHILTLIVECAWRYPGKVL